jgi:hypothetical protein
MFFCFHEKAQNISSLFSKINRKTIYQPKTIYLELLEYENLKDFVKIEKEWN